MTDLLEQLTQAFCCLPGVGKKSAQRMVMALLEGKREEGTLLAELLLKSMSDIRNCASCRNFTENELCRLCSDPGRDKQSVCIVESPSDVLAIEQSGSFQGLYFVLMGHLSPIDGIGPEELGIPELLELLKKNEVKEVIIATNPTVEGEATSYYLSESLRNYDLLLSRIAHGVPLGGELEYVDSHTISHAFSGRKKLEFNS